MHSESFFCICLFVFVANFADCMPFDSGNNNADLDTNTLKHHRRTLPVYPHFSPPSPAAAASSSGVGGGGGGMNGLLKSYRADTYPYQRRYHPIHPMVRFRDESQQDDDDNDNTGDVSYDDSDERSKKSYSAGELLSILTDMARDRGNYQGGGYKGVRFGISR